MKKVIKNINRSLLALLVVTVSVTGCGDFLDINTDPNNPLDSPSKQILPSVETVIFEALGNGSGGMSDLTSQFVHQTAQRGPSNFYFFAGNEFNISNAWPNLYAGALMDIKQIISKSEKTDSWHYLGVAQTLKAYVHSIMIDLWGKTVFTHFGEGTANPFPSYDEGADVYPQLIALLNEATTNLAKETNEPLDAATDLVYQGDEEKWLRLANSLKLKLYNQARGTSVYDATAVADLINNADLMSSVDDGFRLLYSTTNNPENRHPMFKQDYVDNAANYIDPYFYLIMTGDFAGNGQPVMNPILEGIQDPRIPYYFYNQLAGDDPQNPSTSAYFGDFLSIWFASYNIDPNEGFDQAQSQTLVGLYPVGGPFDDGEGVTGGVASGQNPGLGGAGYTRLYPAFADYYTRAELALTMAAPGDARVLFDSAMRYSFYEVNDLAPNDIPAGDMMTYINDVLAKYDAASAAGKLELLITEKWIASFGFSIDSYTDYRRTGYPIMFDPATDNNPFTILNRNFPVSLPYYIDDLQINPNAPAQRNPGTDKVFWDVD
jgi:hypothetical protein